MANWKGTTVPNSGLVEKVYFNTSLSISEVENIIINFSTENLVMDEFGQYIYFILVNTEDTTLLSFSYIPQEELIVLGLTTLTNESLNNVFIFSNKDSFEDGTSVTEGWSLNEITINSEVKSDIGDGSQIGNFNEELSSLISITPFTQSEDKNILMHPKNEDGTANKDVNLYPRTKVGNLLASNGSKFTMPNVAYKQGEWQGEVVPNSGTVEKVYFNTNLSVDEVVSLLETLIFNVPQSETSVNYFLLGKADGSYTIYINKDTNNSNGIPFYNIGIVGVGAFWAEDIGWDLTDNSITINSEVSPVIPVGDGTYLDIGHQNSKLSSLISITPFEESSGGLFETNEDGTPNTDKPIQTGISEERVNELIDLKITGWLGGES